MQRRLKDSARGEEGKKKKNLRSWKFVFKNKNQTQMMSKLWVENWFKSQFLENSFHSFENQKIKNKSWPNMPKEKFMFSWPSYL